MEIFLVNSQHGKKIAYAVAEAKADKLNGWREVNRDEYLQAGKKADVKESGKESIEASSQENATNPSPKRGRPPKNALR